MYVACIRGCFLICFCEHFVRAAFTCAFCFPFGPFERRLIGVNMYTSDMHVLGSRKNHLGCGTSGSSTVALTVHTVVIDVGRYSR